jgi:O-succinylbenzoic acid--CoA ligase
VKIGGESVDLTRLDAILASIAGTHAAVVAVPEPRLGRVIHLAIDPSGEAERILATFNAGVHPFERARGLHRVAEIPRSPLGKLLRVRLLEMISPSVDRRE